MNYICLSVVMSLLLSCGLPASPATVEPVTAMPESPTVTPAPTADIPEPAGDGNMGSVDLRWNPDAEARLLSATFCCGKANREVLLNYIPDARLWGDGRIIWTQIAENGDARTVLEGKLTPEQSQELLQRFSRAGFFGWDVRYADAAVADAAEQCLHVELVGASKQVCESAAGAPAAFHELYAWIVAGAGAAGEAYVPTAGYLTAIPLQFPTDFAPPVDVEWPTATLKFALEEAVNGAWVEGNILETAWQIVNTKWRGVIIQDGDNYYSITLQVAGLSREAPPAR